MENTTKKTAEETEQKLTEYLIERYQPTAIVLHGSRSNGMAKEKSDWDIVMFTEHDAKPLTREIVFGANMELKQFILPIPADKFLGFFFRTENTKILHDPKNIVPPMIAMHDAKIVEGNAFNADDISKRKAYLQSALDGIEGYADSPLILFDKKLDFYSRIAVSWFQFMKNEYEPSHYFAFPRIQKEDPELYALILDFVAATEAGELIRIGKEIIPRLFPS